ncbi:uncharacterized protein LOC123504543 isoform X2 [Portunus trituberculatus]|uniref:uncharacterized protein LOC123504543 isoform X2 n=1 Tax=Portunus trituberculatus TaxID=210409 RepID=UPI001E1D0164|nr:uncharacterized protein LOC123504543 isoform X2 [Portunus trituberculatus]
MVSGIALKRWSAENDTPIYLKSGTEIKTALKNTTPVLSTAIIPFSQIKDKVYYSLTHKEEAMREAVEVWGGSARYQFMLGMGHTGTAWDRWWEQDKAVAILRRFATQTCCHVTIIAHPKKPIASGLASGHDESSLTREGTRFRRAQEDDKVNIVFFVVLT